MHESHLETPNANTHHAPNGGTHGPRVRPVRLRLRKVSSAFGVERRDSEILSTLTQKVRLLSLDQVARTWWGGTKTPEANARRRMAQLTTRGFVERLRVNARPELPLDEPVATWAPGESPPNFGRIAYRLQTRWNEAPRPTLIYVATSKTAKEFGGVGGKHVKPLQASHDLHVSALYLRLLSIDQAEASAWLSEDTLAPFRRHEKLPDAVLADGPTKPRLVIEFGNGYDRNRVAAFHEDCSDRLLPYEIW